LVFLIVGVLIGVQTGRMRDRESQALARERETGLLNRLSTSLVSITGTLVMAETLFMEITQITRTREISLWLSDAAGGVALYYRKAMAECPPNPHAATIANWVFQQSKAVGLPPVPEFSAIHTEGWPVSVPHNSIVADVQHDDIYLPLQTTTHREGVLQIGACASGEFSAYEAQQLITSANLVAVFLERQRLQAAAGKAESLQEADRLKTTLVSSISHELKTPLAAITATVTNLLAEDVHWDVTQMADELRCIQTDLDRLHASIGALLDFARLEGANWQPQRDWYDWDDVLGVTLEKLRDVERARLTFSLPDDLPALYIDCQQMARALQHLLENAFIYAPGDTPIRLGGSSTARETRFWVEDSGPGVPPEERQLIFEKFYRGATAGASPAGTGLGLTIAAEIVRYHQGRLWVEEVHPHGARFVIALPQENSNGYETKPQRHEGTKAQRHNNS